MLTRSAATLLEKIAVDIDMFQSMDGTVKPMTYYPGGFKPSARPALAKNLGTINSRDVKLNRLKRLGKRAIPVIGGLGAIYGAGALLNKYLDSKGVGSEMPAAKYKQY